MVPEDLINPCIPLAVHGTAGKIFRDGKGLLVKDMRGGAAWKVQREYDLQMATYKQIKQIPRLISCEGYFIIMEDLGTSEPIVDLEKCLSGATKLLEGLEAAGVFHNDFQPGNIIIKGDVPFAIDFGWSRWMKDGSPPNPEGDGPSLFRSLRLIKKVGVKAKEQWRWI